MIFYMWVVTYPNCKSNKQESSLGSSSVKPSDFDLDRLAGLRCRVLGSSSPESSADSSSFSEPLSTHSSSPKGNSSASPSPITQSSV